VGLFCRKHSKLEKQNYETMQTINDEKINIPQLKAQKNKPRRLDLGYLSMLGRWDKDQVIAQGNYQSKQADCVQRRAQMELRKSKEAKE